MNKKNTLRDTLLIAAVMAIDLFAVYQYGILMNIREFEAIIAGIFVVALLNIRFYVLALHGWGKYFDTTEGELRKKSIAKLLIELNIVYALLIFSAIVTVRARQIFINLENPAYSNLFMHLVFTVSKILNSIFSFALGLRSARPNIIDLEEESNKAAKESDQADLKVEQTAGVIINRVDTLSATFGLEGFREAILEGRDLSKYINKEHTHFE